MAKIKLDFSKKHSHLFFEEYHEDLQFCSHAFEEIIISNKIYIEEVKAICAKINELKMEIKKYRDLHPDSISDK